MIPIVIGNYDKFDLTEKCINSIKSTLHKDEYRIIQVNNGCKNNIVLSEHYLQYDEPLGFTKAYNEGIRYAFKNLISNWDKIVLVNNDVVFQDNWLKPLVELMDSEEKVALVSCVYSKPDRQEVYWVPTHADILGGRQPIENKYLVKYEQISVNTLQFYFVLINRKFLEDYGLLDETMENFCSDMDMSLRAGLAGWKKYVSFKVCLLHDLNQTINSKDTPDYAKKLKKDQSAFMLKWSGNFFNEILKRTPLFLDKKNISGHIKFYIVDRSSGEVRDYFEDRVIKEKSKIETQDIREQYDQIKRMGVNE